MWLTLAVMLITYLLSPKGNDKEKRQALMNAALAGGATYLATEYTDWGKDLSTRFDGAIGVGGASTTDGTAATSGIKVGATGTAGNTGSTWDTIKNWVVGGVAAGATSSVVSKMPSWVLWVGLGLGAYWILSK